MATNPDKRDVISMISTASQSNVATGVGGPQSLSPSNAGGGVVVAAATGGDSASKGGVNGGSGAVRPGSAAGPRDGGNDTAEALDFMKSAYFVVVISLSIILGVIILIFVTRYARRQYAKGHLDNHPIKKKKTKELSADIERLQYKSYGEIDCDPVLLSESITGSPVSEETEKNYYYRMKALDQIHDLDACIAKSCKTENPLILQQVARVPRSDLKIYFRKSRDPVSIDKYGVVSDTKSGSSSKKRHLQVPADDSSNRKGASSLGTTAGGAPSAYTTQGPLWGTNIELTKKFRIEYDVARFGPPVTFNRERYAQYIEALNNLKQSIEQSKTAKPKRTNPVTGSLAPQGSFFGGQQTTSMSPKPQPVPPTISSFDGAHDVTFVGGGNNTRTHTPRTHTGEAQSRSHHNSFFRVMAAPSATIAATVAGSSHSSSRLLGTSNPGDKQGSYTKLATSPPQQQPGGQGQGQQPHRKQQRSKLRAGGPTGGDTELLQLSLSPSHSRQSAVSTATGEQTTSVVAARTSSKSAVHKGNLSIIPTSNSPGAADMSMGGSFSHEGIATMDESSDTDNTVERIPLLQPVPHSAASSGGKNQTPSSRSETTSRYDSANTRV